MSNEQLKQQGAVTAPIFSSEETYIPQSVKFTNIKNALPAKRTPVIIRAEQQAYSSNQNKKMRINLPSNTLYDTRNGYIKFDISISTTGGTYKRIHWNSGSILNRLRVIAGAAEIEGVIDYNRIVNIVNEQYITAQVTASMSGQEMGFGTEVERNALGATNSTMGCYLFSGVFGTELLPFDNIGTGVTLELWLEDGTACVETDGANPVINITNLEFHIERLDLEASYRSYIKSYVARNGLKIGYHTYARYVNAMTTGPRQDFQILHKSSSMNGIANIFVLSTDINNTTVNNRFLNWPRLGMTQTQMQINGAIFPDEPIDTQAANALIPYQMYCRWINRWKLDGNVTIKPPLSHKAFSDNRYVQMDDFEPYPEEDDLINPMTTLNPNSVIIKRLYFNAAIPPNYQLDSWVQYFVQAEIFTDGSVKVLQ
jgi:hypothetical protein